MHIYRERDEIVVSRCNFVRSLQLACCLSCGVITVFNFRFSTLTELSIYVSFILISSSYSLITFIDVSARFILHISIQFNLWSIYSFAACFMFLSCAACYPLLIIMDEHFWTPLMLTAYAVCGCLFLWDGILILLYQKSIALSIAPEPEGSEKTTVQRESPLSSPTDVVEFLGIIHAEPLEEVPIYKNQSNELIRSRSNSLHKYEKPRPQISRNRYKRTTKLIQRTITTYGGTFHMSRDVAPLPSPKICDSTEPKMTKVQEQPEPQMSI